MDKVQPERLLKSKTILIQNKIPKDFFVTTGVGESDITVHAGSYHLALLEAGIERCNIMTYSSILPGIANEVEKTPALIDSLIHGSVMDTITASATAAKKKRATAGIIFGWLYDKKNGKRYGGLVCEYNGHDSEQEAGKSLHASLNELYTNGYSEKFHLKDTRLTMKSFVPKKKYGTALVAICFLNYKLAIREL